MRPCTLHTVPCRSAHRSQGLEIATRHLRAACAVATPCPLYVFLTGTGMKIVEPELMLLREMTAHGFVSVAL